MTAAVAPAQALSAVHRGPRRIEPLLYALLFAMVATSSIVWFEPAPCDVLFVPTAIVALLAGYPLIGAASRPVVYWSLLVFVGANLWTLPGAEDVAAAVRFAAITFYMLAMWLLIVAVIAVHGGRAVRMLVCAFCVAALVAAGVGLAAWAGVLPMADMFFRDSFGLRVQGTFKDPNVFAPFLVAASVFTITHVLHHARRFLVPVLALGAFAAGTLLSFSRGAYVNLAVALAVLAALELLVVRDPRAARRVFWLGVPVAIAGVAALGALLSQSGLDEFFARRLSLQSYDTNRFSNQWNALLVAAVEPLGIGPGQWAEPRYPLATHSLYVRVLVENGWIGLLSLLVFAGACTMAALRGVLRRSRFMAVHVASAAILAGILVESIVIDTLHWRHLFFALAVPVGLDGYERLAGSRADHAFPR